MRKTTTQTSTWDVSFFQKKDAVKTEKYGNSETFESPKRQIEQIGEASLLFTRFDVKDIPNMYKENEKAYALDSFGKFMVAEARELAMSNMFEVMIMLRSKKHNIHEQMICNLWIKNQNHVFSTYMDSRNSSKKRETSYLGGFTWWSSEETDMNVKKLLLPKNMNILSNICISVATLPNQFHKKELEDDIDDMFFW